MVNEVQLHQNFWLHRRFSVYTTQRWKNIYIDQVLWQNIGLVDMQMY